MSMADQLKHQVEAMRAEAIRLREGAATLEAQCNALLATPKHTAEELRKEEAKRQAVLRKYQPKKRGQA